MIRILALLTVLSCVGCQTTPKHENKEITSSKEVVTVLVAQFDRYGKKIDKPQSFGSEYRITVKWDHYKADGTQIVASAPMLTMKPNKWSTLRVGTPHSNLESTISYLIEGEKIELQTVNGINLTSKIVPSTEQTVLAKGIISISKMDKSGQLINRSVPFNAKCNLDKPKTVYENEIKLEPVN